MAPEAPGPAPRAQRLLLGAALVALAELMFVSAGASIRVVAAELSNAEVVFFRNLIGMLLLLPWLGRHGAAGLHTEVPLLHLLRGLAGLVAMYCFFYALAHMPLAEAMLLKLSSPLFIPLIALAWLGERVPGRVRWGLGVGFAGVALILHPGLGPVSPVALVALLGGLSAALAMVSVRRLGRSEPTVRIVFHFTLVGTLVSALPLYWYWQTPSPRAWLWLGAIGLFATLGQLLLTRGFALAPAARMGTFGFFSVLFGGLYGWLFWAETLSWTTLAGSLLVLLAGVLATRAERPTPDPSRDTPCPSPT